MFKAIQKMKVREDKGFTLVELLIVVAIIGILAAIAIPQFSAYRIRGYNTAGASDTRNIKIQAEAFMSDWQVYASTAVGGVVSNDGVIQSGPANVAIAVAQAAIVTTTPGLPSSATTFGFGISNGVKVAINTGANGANYVAAVKHTSGDRGFATDSDITNIKWKTIAVGTELILTDVPDATSGDDVTATYANGL